MKVLAVLMAVAIALFIEKKNLKKHWSKKERIIFFIFLSIGTAISIAWVLQVDLINPMEVIAKIYRPLSEPYISYMNQFK